MAKEKNYLIPLLLVTSLFFLWGLAYGLLDVLNKHFQETLHITKQRSALLQAAYFGAYFTMALPAGYFMKRKGYKKGIIAGLLFYAAGALLFYPSAEIASFPFFLFSLFILASGLAFLETAANPYITILGPSSTSAFRLNFAQSFNGVGSFIGPIIGASLFFSNKSGQLGSVKTVYIAIAALVLLFAFFFYRTPLPEIKETSIISGNGDQEGLFQFSHFKWAVAAQFFYVAAQVGIAAFFINYCTEKALGISNAKASWFLSAGLFIFTAGRFAGSALMKWIEPNKLLAAYAFINIMLCICVINIRGMVSIYSLLAIFFFESIMFPTIFALGIKGLGVHTKKASSFIIMAIAGGAVMPYLMGSLAEAYSTSFAYIIPLVCFVFVLIFGLYGYKVKLSQ